MRSFGASGTLKAQYYRCYTRYFLRGKCHNGNTSPFHLRGLFTSYGQNVTAPSTMKNGPSPEADSTSLISKEELELFRRRRKTDWKRRQGGQSFLDNIIVTVRGGKGGNGCAAFHREKFKPFGPPSGGDGGRGGDVYILPTSHLTSLSSVPSKIRGDPGGNGQGTWQNGRAGAPLVIRVPVGTVVRQLPWDDPRRALDAWEAEEEALRNAGIIDPKEKMDAMREKRWVHYPRFEERNVDKDTFKDAEMRMYDAERTRRLEARRKAMQKPLFLDLDEDEGGDIGVGPSGRDIDAPLGVRAPENLGHLIARGGTGGLGNPHFVSSDTRSPKFATRGFEGERLTLSLELKLLADVGLVGMPNAGKSTLLRALTGGRAKSEVAGYAFTTLNPVVGIVRVAKDGVFEGELSGVDVHDETWKEEIREYEYDDDDAQESEQSHLDPSPSLEPSPSLDNSLSSVSPEETSETPIRPGHHFDLYETFRFTIADNPGLIENASDNVGLGHAFLRSIERSMALVYVVDLSTGGAGSTEPWDQLSVLRDELEKYQPGMSEKARIVLANKADLLVSSSGLTSSETSDDTETQIQNAKSRLAQLEAYVKEEMRLKDGRYLDVIPVSAKYSQNLRKVVELLSKYVFQERNRLKEDT